VIILDFTWRQVAASVPKTDGSITSVYIAKLNGSKTRRTGFHNQKEEGDDGLVSRGQKSCQPNMFSVIKLDRRCSDEDGKQIQAGVGVRDCKGMH
jgi:hypothetical protein